MTKAIIRPDLEGQNPPHSHGYIENDGTVFECWQPDELDGQEFNLVLKNPKTEEMFLAMSIDFDYPDTEIEKGQQYKKNRNGLIFVVDSVDGNDIYIHELTYPTIKIMQKPDFLQQFTFYK